VLRDSFFRGRRRERRRKKEDFVEEEHMRLLPTGAERREASEVDYSLARKRDGLWRWV
jgi:hypothetical protein